MLYLQNGDRIVAVYFVTSFHPMCSKLLQDSYFARNDLHLIVNNVTQSSVRTACRRVL